MARTISPAMRPYVELQRRLPKGTPFSERARAAKALKAELARGGGRRRNPSGGRRSNPGGIPTELLVVAAIGGLWYLGHKSRAATPATPPNMAPSLYTGT